MSKSLRHQLPAKITVGDLITELCRWPDHAVIQFHCASAHAEFCLSAVEGRTPGIVEIELNAAPASATIAPM